MKSRLEELYQKEICPALRKELSLKNVMEIPKLSKIVLNIGVKDAIADSKVLNGIKEVVEKIAGQAAVKTIAKKSIAAIVGGLARGRLVLDACGYAKPTGQHADARWTGGRSIRLAFTS